jgi:hypothetical protein
LVTVKVYEPAARPDSVMVVPDPTVDTLSGLRIMVQVPTDGKPFRITLPPPPEQVMPVTVPIKGAEGRLLTDRANVATADWHGVPRGLSVVAVIVTILPLSPAEGV